MTSISVTTSSTSRRSSASSVATLLGDTAVHALWTGVGDGDLSSVGRGQASGSLPVTVPRDLVVRRLRQVHAAQVVVLGTPVPPGALCWVPGPDDAPPEGDALVAVERGYALVVLTADCASVALGSPEGIHAAVHVGWRGVSAGVLGRSIEAMRALGASEVVAGLGPCIGPCCNEFSPDDLEGLIASCGTDVRGRTTWGTPSLDLPAAVRGQLSLSGVLSVAATDTCTMCTPGYFSHRGRRDKARQALVVWRAA
jgi:copper oxidase (laccase) domain-containing protein